jgi:hypothetical protein
MGRSSVVRWWWSDEERSTQAIGSWVRDRWLGMTRRAVRSRFGFIRSDQMQVLGMSSTSPTTPEPRTARHHCATPGEQPSSSRRVVVGRRAVRLGDRAGSGLPPGGSGGAVDGGVSGEDLEAEGGELGGSLVVGPAERLGDDPVAVGQYAADLLMVEGGEPDGQQVGG